MDSPTWRWLWVDVNEFMIQKESWHKAIIGHVWISHDAKRELRALTLGNN